MLPSRARPALPSLPCFALSPSTQHSPGIPAPSLPLQLHFHLRSISQLSLASPLGYGSFPPSPKTAGWRPPPLFSFPLVHTSSHSPSPLVPAYRKERSSVLDRLLLHLCWILRKSCVLRKTRSSRSTPSKRELLQLLLPYDSVSI